MNIASRLEAVRERIERAAKAAGREPGDVQLVAVSKRHSVDAIREAHAAGQRVFGENYVQELVEKHAALADLPDLRWHFIGHLQRNKSRHMIETGAWLETLDSERLAASLQRLAGRVNVPVSIQVNVSGETQKSGVLPERLAALESFVRSQPSLTLRGLMTVPPSDPSPERARPHFARLAELSRLHGLPELSMGMSADLEVAIAEGATMVRVGTAIFGARPDAAPPT